MNARHFATAVLLGMAASAPVAEAGPTSEPEPCGDGRWRQRVRNRLGRLDTFWGDSAEAVTAQVVEWERIEAERAEQERLARIEAEIRWAEGAPAREEAHRAWLADQPRREAAERARRDEEERAIVARYRASLCGEARERIDKAEAKRARKAAKRGGGR